jgi:hypothetical protein
MTDAILISGDCTIEGDTLKISVILVKSNTTVSLGRQVQSLRNTRLGKVLTHEAHSLKQYFQREFAQLMERLSILSDTPLIMAHTSSMFM